MPLAARPLTPVLKEGDRLSSAEFLRRWDAMPELKQAELIDGVVFMASPVKRSHSVLHTKLTGWLWTYEEATPGCETASDGTWILGPGDVPQPDVALAVIPEYGGQSRIEGDYPIGAPELVVEVGVSTSSRDLGVKLELYRRAGVREYVSVIAKTKQVIWRQLVRGRYREIALDEDGLLRSRVFPGLWLDPEALWDRTRSVRTAADKGTASPEHAAFVERLAARRRK